MHPDFTKEIQKVFLQLKQADTYLACEKIIQETTRLWMGNGCTDMETENYLRELLLKLEKEWQENPGSVNSSFRYAAAYTRTIVSGFHWRSWLRSPD